VNARLLDLRERRGMLRARCAQQREALAQHAVALMPVSTVVGWGWEGAQWVRRHPGAVGAAVMVFVLLKPRRIWRVLRWSQRLYRLRRFYPFLRFVRRLFFARVGAN